jgi:hypothetical protein
MKVGDQHHTTAALPMKIRWYSLDRRVGWGPMVGLDATEQEKICPYWEPNRSLQLYWMSYVAAPDIVYDIIQEKCSKLYRIKIILSLHFSFLCHMYTKTFCAYRSAVDSLSNLMIMTAHSVYGGWSSGLWQYSDDQNMFHDHNENLIPYANFIFYSHMICHATKLKYDLQLMTM